VRIIFPSLRYLMEKLEEYRLKFNRIGVKKSRRGNCFTIVSNTADPAKVADTLSDSRTVRRLTGVCEQLERNPWSPLI